MESQDRCDVWGWGALASLENRPFLINITNRSMSRKEQCPIPNRWRIHLTPTCLAEVWEATIISVPNGGDIDYIDDRDNRDWKWRGKFKNPKKSTHPHNHLPISPLNVRIIPAKRGWMSSKVFLPDFSGTIS